jgi:predicted nucleotidyltransferase
LEIYVNIAREIYLSRYPTAQFLIVAGSLIRGEGTKSSDLDILVVFDRLGSAYRESFVFRDIMVEAFAHDLSTLRYFIYNLDYHEGIPVMATMINEGLVLPQETELSRQVKKLAREHLAEGPAPANAEKVRGMRYSISNLMDDLKDSRNRFEQIATACRLYEELAQLYFATNRFWRGQAKSTPRVMNQYDSEFSLRFHHGFDVLFNDGDDSNLVEVAEEILGATGGYLFEGFKVVADPAWRLEIE